MHTHTHTRIALTTYLPEPNAKDDVVDKPSLDFGGGVDAVDVEAAVGDAGQRASPSKERFIFFARDDVVVVARKCVDSVVAVASCAQARGCSRARAWLRRC